MPLISIIIPVYKVEKYLCRCLNSVLAQTFIDFECILINDASPDNSPAICDEYVTRDSRFKVIHKQCNEGLPAARKSGLDIAKSDFIIHLDSDDWLASNALELLYNKQQETDADVVLGGFKEVFPYKTELHIFPDLDRNDNPAIYCFLPWGKIIWGRLYRKKLFDNYIVPTENIGEDFIVNVQIFLKLDIISVKKIDDVVYYHDRNSDSMMNNVSYSSYIYNDDPGIRCHLWVEEYLKKHCQRRDVISAFIGSMIVCAINPYLRLNRRITKREIDIFYNRYYKAYEQREKIIFSERVLIPLFHVSKILGKILVIPLVLLSSGSIKDVIFLIIKRLKRQFNKI
jgi:glycosyltransferase involved in cell wall biosynthesis